MKTTFKQYLSEAEEKMPRAKSQKDLRASIVNGHFTKDGSKLKVTGDFDCHLNKLESLEGCPQTVGGDFDCGNNLLESLLGCPQTVSFGGFYCYENKLKSLKGCPQTLGGYFNCGHNQLESLEGCPQTVGGGFLCRDNHLTSLESIHMHVHEIGSQANFRLNPINSHVLGLLKIKGLRVVYLDNEAVQNIVNKYLRGTTGKDPSLRDIVDCQEELMDNDLEDYALL